MASASAAAASAVARGAARRHEAVGPLPIIWYFTVPDGGAGPGDPQSGGRGAFAPPAAATSRDAGRRGLVLGALPTLEGLASPEEALAADPNPADATMQAFFDTILPGRPATRTDLGNPIHPRAIAGADDEPGAVEADALLLAHHPKIGFDTLEGPLAGRAVGPLADRRRGLPQPRLRGPPRDRHRRARVLESRRGSSSRPGPRSRSPPSAPPPPSATRPARPHPGYKVMGHPGTAPHGYRDFSYRRRLARERTRKGYLP